MPSTHKGVYLANGDGTANEYASNPGANGHIIQNSTGAPVTERPNLQFNNAFKLSDDSTNDATVVQVDGNVVDQATNIGPIETAATASAGHAQDTLFIWQGQLVKATQQINAGDSISGKAQATSISTEQQDIASRLDFLENVSQIASLEV